MRTLADTKMQELAIPRENYESVEDSFDKVFQKLDDRNALQQNELSVRLKEIEILQQQKQTATQELKSLNDNKSLVKKELEAMNKTISDLTKDKQKLEAKINGNPPAASRDYGTGYSNEFDGAASSLQQVLSAAGRKFTETRATWQQMNDYVKKKQQQYSYYPAEQNVAFETVLEDLLISLQTAGQNDKEGKAALDQYNRLVQEVASLQTSLYKVGNQTVLLESDKLQLNHTISLLKQKNHDLTMKLGKQSGALSP
uniref:Uncharacterized protein n=1 Tax=Anopheles albimanus TaxID=7167 RepID=A0A182FEU1_ANOAL